MTLYKMTNEFATHNRLNIPYTEYILCKTPHCYWYLMRMEQYSIKLGISKLKAGHINKVLKNMELLQFVCTFNKYNELPTNYPELSI